MKGLLHRLAGRAAGTAATVRSGARLPFGAERFDADAAPDDRIDAALATPPPAERPPAMTASVGDTLEGTSDPSVTGPLFETSTERLASSVEEAAAEPTSSPSRPARAPSPQRLLPRRSSSDVVAPDGLSDTEGEPPQASHATAPELSRIEPEPQARRTPSRAVQARPALEPNAPGSAAPESGGDAADRLVAPSSSESPSIEPISPTLASPVTAPPEPAPPAPAPLIPPNDVEVHLSENPTNGNPRVDPTGGVALDESAEVHVHIGRIEVTAVHETPRPRARPRRRTPISLDAYLAAREES